MRPAVSTTSQGLFKKPPFFVEYGDELVVGAKIGERGQAEIFNAAIGAEDEYVLKVFKPGFSLRDLDQRHWTVRGNPRTDEGHCFHCCFIKAGTMLRDGNFAFVMKRYWCDLRKLIDQEMKDNNGRGPPFLLPQALDLMWKIAKGIEYLHGQGILHRDLKASNVLVTSENMGGFNNIDVADFESSQGVQGTGFWRAPEVLQAFKNRVSNIFIWREIWTWKPDMYSYAMTSYEILTGRIPFGDLAGNKYDAVIRGERPLLPDYVDHDIQELLRRC